MHIHPPDGQGWCQHWGCTGDAARSCKLASCKTSDCLLEPGWEKGSKSRYLRWLGVGVQDTVPMPVLGEWGTFTLPMSAWAIQQTWGSNPLTTWSMNKAKKWRVIYTPTRYMCQHLWHFVRSASSQLGVLCANDIIKLWCLSELPMASKEGCRHRRDKGHLHHLTQGRPDTVTVNQSTAVQTLRQTSIRDQVYPQWQRCFRAYHYCKMSTSETWARPDVPAAPAPRSSVPKALSSSIAVWTHRGCRNLPMVKRRSRNQCTADHSHYV